jgi:hypothetical protein
MSANTRNCCGVLIGACVLVSGITACGPSGRPKSLENGAGSAAEALKTDAGASSTTVGQQEIAWGSLSAVEC